MPEMPDFESIMQMAQNAQAELQKAQDNLDKIEVEGVAGGGLVKIQATAKGRILTVDIDSLWERGDGRGGHQAYGDGRGISGMEACADHDHDWVASGIARGSHPYCSTDNQA